RGDSNKGQQKFLVQTNWNQFHFNARGTRFNPYENILSPNRARSLELKWSYPLGEVSSAPVVVDGAIYVATNDENVYALKAQTGTKLWKFKGGYTFYSGPAVAEGVVYVGCQDSKLYALDSRSGAELWSFAADTWFSSSPAVVNGV